jgi:type IV secretory pathway VirD2 relaxase
MIAHLRYVEREGVQRDGSPGILYSADEERVHGRDFLASCSEDRHQFRLILSPEDGDLYDDMKPLVRSFMARMEKDLSTSLRWIAVDHSDTAHPHSHLILRGRDDRGADLIIAREYITKGLRQRAVDLVNLDLGPRTDREIMRSNLREISQERFTGIDRRLLQAVDEQGLVSPRHRDGVEQSLRAGRLATLSRMGLADEEQRGRWRLAENVEPTLRAMGRRGDIIAMLDREVRSRSLAVSPIDYAVYDPADKEAQPVVGQVLTRGRSDEETDREHLIVDAIDGRTHYVEIGEGGGADMSIREGAIVRISPTPVEARDVDRTVAEIAARNGGRYSEDIHLLHDPSASERFVRAHIRRLEALRRGKAGVQREVDGSWKIAPDHVGRVRQYERARAAREPVRVDILSVLRLEEMPNHNGITWLDEDPTVSQPGRAGGGFGVKVAEALRQRQQWLVEQGLAEQPDMLDKLRTRELQRVARQLSRELGLGYAEAAPGDPIDGIYRRPVQVGSARMALIENSREFALVPWRPVLERRIGREVSGVMRGRDVSWAFGRERSGPEIG